MIMESRVTVIYLLNCRKLHTSCNSIEGVAHWRQLIGRGKHRCCPWRRTLEDFSIWRIPRQMSSLFQQPIFSLFPGQEDLVMAKSDLEKKTDNKSKSVSGKMVRNAGENGSRATLKREQNPQWPFHGESSS